MSNVVALPTRSAATRPPKPRRRGDHRSARHAEMDLANRALRRRMIRWALSNGRPINVDAAALIIALVPTKGPRKLQITEAEVSSLLWFKALEWCQGHSVEVPDSIAATLATLVDFAAEHDLLHRHSSTVKSLHQEIASIDPI